MSGGGGGLLLCDRLRGNVKFRNTEGDLMVCLGGGACCYETG